MSLFQTIQKDFISARKNRDAFATKVLSMLVSDLKYLIINNQEDELENSDVIAVIQKNVKQQKEALLEFEKSGRDNLATEAKNEIELLSKYLPAQLSKNEIHKIVLKAKSETGAKSPADMGAMMKIVMPLIKGQADGKIVKSIVMDALKN